MCLAFPYLGQITLKKFSTKMKYLKNRSNTNNNYKNLAQDNKKNLFNRFACFWPKGYQLGSLGKSHQNGDYLKQAMRKIVFPQESNLQTSKNILIDLLLQSYNKQVAGFK